MTFSTVFFWMLLIHKYLHKNSKRNQQCISNGAGTENSAHIWTHKCETFPIYYGVYLKNRCATLLRCQIEIMYHAYHHWFSAENSMHEFSWTPDWQPKTSTLRLAHFVRQNKFRAYNFHWNRIFYSKQTLHNIDCVLQQIYIYTHSMDIKGWN